SHDLIGRCRSRARESATLKHSVERFRETAIHSATKCIAVWLENVGNAELQSLATQENQQATHTDFAQVFISAQRVRVEHEKAARLLSYYVDECVLECEASFGQERRLERDHSSQWPVRRRDPRAASQSRFCNRAADGATRRHRNHRIPVGFAPDQPRVIDSSVTERVDFAKAQRGHALGRWS